MFARVPYGKKTEYVHFDFDDPVGAEGFGSSPQPGKLVDRGIQILNYLERGFLNPKDVTIPTLADEIQEGEERLCFATTVYSTSGVFLSFKEDFPNRVDSFIYHTGEMYSKHLREPRRWDLLPSLGKLVVGSVVIANVRDEWNRAKIISIQHLKNGCGPSYYILLLDLGEYHTVWSNDFYYIHKDLIKQPWYAFRTTLAPEAYEKYGKGFGSQEAWDKKMSAVILKCVMNKAFMAKFLRKVEDKGEMIWEISILHWEGSNVNSENGIPLDQKLFMSVRDADGEEDHGRRSCRRGHIRRRR